MRRQDRLALAYRPAARDFRPLISTHNSHSSVAAFLTQRFVNGGEHGRPGEIAVTRIPRARSVRR